MEAITAIDWTDTTVVESILIPWGIRIAVALAILVLVLSINLFGEGLRDILDPRLKVE